MNPFPLTAGMEIDGFRLEAPVPTGGMASLWRVSRAGSTMPMVMKMPLMRRGENPITIVGFEAERMILPRLSGPHVPRFVSAGNYEQPYIVMEFVEGISLKQHLDAAPLASAEVARLGAKVATALHDLHRQNVVHLDLKPANVILRPSGEAVLLDFGLSRHDHLPDLVGGEFEGPIGTAEYISPEQVTGVRGDPRSDQFGLGVILYVLATGEFPFGEPASAGEWRRRLWRDPLPPRSRRADVAPWLQEIILRCLEVEPSARYATAAQLAFDLQNPDQVVLTKRASRTARDGIVSVARRWLKTKQALPLPQRSVAGHLARAPIIMVAIDLAPEHQALADALAVAVGRILSTEPGARLACVNVLRTSRIALDPTEDEAGRNLHQQRLAALAHWARPLRMPEARVTCHVFESPDPADSLIQYARDNQVDHIVLGCRGSSTLRRYLGSVSTQVVAEAPCTVTVVRTARDREVSSETSA